MNLCWVELKNIKGRILIYSPTGERVKVKSATNKRVVLVGEPGSAFGTTTIMTNIFYESKQKDFEIVKETKS